MSAGFSPDRPRARSATDAEKEILTKLGFKIDHAEWNGHRVPESCEVYLRFFDFVRVLIQKAERSSRLVTRDPWWTWLEYRSLDEAAWWFHKHQQDLPGAETVRDVENSADNYQRLFAFFAEYEVRGRIDEETLPEPAPPGPLPKGYYNWKAP